MKIAGLLFFLLVASPLLAQEDPSPSQRLLAEHGIEATREAIDKYFESMSEAPYERSRFAALIKDLSNDSYIAREAATKRLLNSKVAHFDLLEEAAKSRNAEQRHRAQRILDALKANTSKKQNEGILSAALRVVANHKIKGINKSILRITPLCNDKTQLPGIIRAVRATVDPNEQDLFDNALKHESAAVRVVAIAGIEEILGIKSIASISPLLVDADESVRLAASRVLANLGDRQSLPTLGEMLKSNNSEVRSQSVYVLRQLSGQRFGFQAFEDPGNQAGAVAQWNKWIGGEGATAKLNFPIENFEVDPSGLVLDFSFEHGGDQVRDKSEYANHGEIVNASQTVKGREGAGCLMDGSGDYIRIPNSASLEITDHVSLAVWVKLDSFGPGGYGNEDGYIIKKGDPLWWNPTFGLGYSKRNHQAKFVIGDPHAAKNGGGKSLYSKDPLEVGRWHLLVGTYDGKTVKLFVDGQLEQEAEYAGQIRGDKAPVMLGGGKLSSKAEFANHFAISGTIDEVKIYNRALSAAEVDFLFNK